MKLCDGFFACGRPASSVRNMGCISRGGPGRATTCLSAPASRSVATKPGAVPFGFSRIRAPAGNNACLRLLSVSGMPNSAKRRSMCCQLGRSNSRATPASCATTSAVRSSSVGPRPPVMNTQSARASAVRSTKSRSPRRSPAVSMS